MVYFEIKMKNRHGYLICINTAIFKSYSSIREYKIQQSSMINIFSYIKTKVMSLNHVLRFGFLSLEPLNNIILSYYLKSSKKLRFSQKPYTTSLELDEAPPKPNLIIPLIQEPNLEEVKMGVRFRHGNNSRI